MAAVKIIRETGEFKNADIVMVTDGCASVSNAWLDSYEQAKAELDFSCYSVLVGSYCKGEVNEKFSDEVEHLANAIRDEEQMHHLFGKV